MNLHMPTWMKEWIESQDETATSYINRLIDNHKYLFPGTPINSFTKNGTTYYIYNPDTTKNLQLTPTNKEKIKNLPRRTTIYAHHLRTLIAEDFLTDGENEEQQLIPFQTMVKKLHKKKINIKKINKQTPVKYTLARTPTEFVEKTLNTRSRVSYIEGMSKILPRDEGHMNLYYRLHPDEQMTPITINLNHFFANLSQTNPKLSWILPKIHTHYSDNWRSLYQEYLNNPKSKRLIPVALSYTSLDDGGVLLGYPDKIETKKIRNTHNIDPARAKILYRIHSETKPAISWGNEKYWVLDNIPVPRKAVEDPQNITKDEFVNIKNAELRRMITERMGTDKFVSLLNLQLIDVGGCGELYRTEEKDEVAGDYLWFVKVICPSTHREYHLPINRKELSYPTADEAVAWTFNKTARTYHPKVET